MSDYVPVRVEVGPSQSILVEAEAPVGYQNVSIASVNLDALLDQVRQFAARLRPALQQSSPEKISVEFGVSFSVEAGELVAMITKGSATGSITITLEWADGSKP